MKITIGRRVLGGPGRGSRRGRGARRRDVRPARRRRGPQRGSCGGLAHELTVESENDGLEVSFELQADQVGQTWDVTLEQDGTTLLEGERRTDEDAELDVDAHADDTAGADEFTVAFAQRLRDPHLVRHPQLTPARQRPIPHPRRSP